MKKLITIDLDGTLLSDDGTISAENVEAIHEAQNAGHIVAISSGRSKQDTAHILAQTGIVCPMTNGNGGKSYHADEELQTWTLTETIVSELLTILKQANVYYEIYTHDGIMYNPNQEAILTEEINILKQETNDSLEWADTIFQIQMSQHGLIRVDDYQTIELTNLGIYKVFILSFDTEKLAQLNSLLADKEVSLTTSGQQKLEISHQDASKGNGLIFMANHFQIPMENTVAIGDNFNDLSMIQVAGTGIAMGNAEDDVKKQSTHVTLAYNENGVAYALKNFLG